MESNANLPKLYLLNAANPITFASCINIFMFVVKGVLENQYINEILTYLTTHFITNTSANNFVFVFCFLKQHFNKVMRKKNCVVYLIFKICKINYTKVMCPKKHICYVL